MTTRSFFLENTVFFDGKSNNTSMQEKELLEKSHNLEYTMGSGEKEIILSLLNDYIFKNVFGVEGHEHLLEFLVNTVLKDKGFKPVHNLILKNSEIIKQHNWQKTSALDIRADDENGNELDIEVQVREEENYKGRSLFYWVKLYSLQAKKGDFYTDLKPAICINFCNFILFPNDDKFHHCIMAKDIDENGEIYSQDLKLYFIELPKIKQIESKLEEIAYILKNLTEKTRDAMKSILLKDPVYEEIQAYFENCIEDEETSWAAIAHERAMLDYASGLYSAQQKGIREGIEKGLQQGAHEKAIETATKFLAMGLTVEQVVEGTGLSEQEILSIRNT